MIKTLPDELWTRIIGKINSIAQLAQCRLVCRKWNRPSEAAMFGKPIAIKSDKQALDLYCNLLRNPSNGRLIKHLTLNCDVKSMTILGELMHLAFTPSMEYIDGTLVSDDFFLLLGDIANNSSVKFINLKSIPCPNFATEPYFNASLKFKESLTTMVLKFDYISPVILCFVEQLDKFKCLTSFSFYGGIDTIYRVEHFLRGCNHLKELTMDILLHDDLHDKNEIVRWAMINAKRIDSLKRLVISGSCRSDLTEYLLYKYPYVSSIKILPVIWNTFELEGTNQMMIAAKKVPLRQIKLMVSADADILDALRNLISHDIDYTVVSVTEEGDVYIRINNP